jgi:hypothetical protein
MNQPSVSQVLLPVTLHIVNNRIQILTSTSLARSHQVLDTPCNSFMNLPELEASLHHPGYNREVVYHQPELHLMLSWFRESGRYHEQS